MVYLQHNYVGAAAGLSLHENGPTDEPTESTGSKAEPTTESTAQLTASTDETTAKPGVG